MHPAYFAWLGAVKRLNRAAIAKAASIVILIAFPLSTDWAIGEY